MDFFQARCARAAAWFLLCAFVVLAVGCGGRTPPSAESARQVRVEWLGNMAFSITGSLGTEILTNPFAPGTTSHPQPRGLRPHVLLVSHERSDANYVDISTGTPRIFRGSVGVGPNNAAGLRINGVAVHPEGTEADPLGLNVVYTWAMDGVRFCFAGAIPRALTSREVASIGTVDVLFLPIGQPAGLSDATRNEIVRQLRPKVVIPMAHTTASANRWAASYADVRMLSGRSVVLSSAMLAGLTSPLVLVFSR